MRCWMLYGPPYVERGATPRFGAPIAEIAQLVGFRTPSHFTTTFRRVTGMTPSAYRGEAGAASVGGTSVAATVVPSTSYAVLSLGKPPVRRSDAASTANGSRSSVRGPCRVLAESASLLSADGEELSCHRFSREAMSKAARPPAQEEASGEDDMERFEGTAAMELVRGSVESATRVNAFLKAVYGWMCAGLAITALVAYSIA